MAELRREHWQKKEAERLAENVHLVHVGVVQSVDKSNAWTFVRVRLWKFNVHFPDATFVWCCSADV